MSHSDRPCAAPSASACAKVVARGGEVWVNSPSKAAGYYGMPEKTASDFNARLAGVDGSARYLRTGDLGFLHGGELFICGRQKDLVIVRGRNHYPQDIERTAEGDGSALRPGCSAAFSVACFDGGEERLALRKGSFPASARRRRMYRNICFGRCVRIYRNICLLRFISGMYRNIFLG